MCQNMEQILNNPASFIYSDNFCNCLYISTTKLYVCNYSSHFFLFHCVRVEDHWTKVGEVTILYLFLKTNVLFY